MSYENQYSFIRNQLKTNNLFLSNEKKSFSIADQLRLKGYSFDESKFTGIADQLRLKGYSFDESKFTGIADQLRLKGYSFDESKFTGIADQLRLKGYSFDESKFTGIADQLRLKGYSFDESKFTGIADQLRLKGYSFDESKFTSIANQLSITSQSLEGLYNVTEMMTRPLFYRASMLNIEDIEDDEMNLAKLKRQLMLFAAQGYQPLYVFVLMYMAVTDINLLTFLFTAAEKPLEDYRKKHKEE